MLDKKVIDEVTFKESFIGYNKSQVDIFLDSLASEVDSLNLHYADICRKRDELTAENTELRKKLNSAVKKNAQLAQKNGELEGKIGELTSSEKQSPVSPEKQIEDIIRAKTLAVFILKKAREECTNAVNRARDESRRIVNDALSEGEALLSDARLRSEEIVTDAEESAQTQRESFVRMRNFMVSLAEEFAGKMDAGLQELNELASRVNSVDIGDALAVEDSPYTEIPEEAQGEACAEDEVTDTEIDTTDSEIEKARAIFAEDIDDTEDTEDFDRILSIDLNEIINSEL